MNQLALPNPQCCICSYRVTAELLTEHGVIILHGATSWQCAIANIREVYADSYLYFVCQPSVWPISPQCKEVANPVDLHVL